MNQNLVFCEECRDDVAFTVSDTRMTGIIKGVHYQYSGREAHCPACGALLYVPKINDYNLKALYDVYREQNGIISLALIRAIPEKYAIGKRPLSLLLGWGELTFSRYYDGDLPTRQYSDVLKKIYEDPDYYSKLLEAGKDNLKSKLSYVKSKKAVCALLDASSAPGTKINIAIRYLLSQCEDITPLALQKALYYIQGFHYAFYHTFLFAEDCEAWVHGPVYRDIYFRYRDYRFDPISPNKDFDFSQIMPAEKIIFDSVIHHLCCYSGKMLECFTHREAPWLNARGRLPLSAPSERVITQSSIGEYFCSVKETYHMTEPCDIRAYALDMFSNTADRKVILNADEIGS